MWVLLMMIWVGGDDDDDILKRFGVRYRGIQQRRKSKRTVNAQSDFSCENESKKIG